MVTIYFAGGEDIDHFATGPANVSTDTSLFRPAYARVALRPVGSSGLWTNNVAYVGTPSTFWFTARVNFGNSYNSGPFNVLQFLDGTGFARLRIYEGASGGIQASTPMTVQKCNTAGTYTTLTNTLTSWTYVASSAADKLDIYWDNQVSGTLNIYINGILVFNYSGDTTTETTTIAKHQLGQGNSGNDVGWSEIIVLDVDTRSMSMQTVAPVAFGNTHNFDVGPAAAANVNETTLNDATLNGSTSAGQIDQYTIPALATGVFTILAFGIQARMRKGTTSPSKMDLGVRVSSTDYWSSDISLTGTFASYSNWWLTDPSTSAVWAALPTNIGLKSVT